MSANQRILLMSVAAFLLYGTWAIYANIEHGSVIAVRAGLAQGVYSFVSTVLITLLLETVYARAAVMPVLVAGTVGITCTVTLITATHIAVGTPNLLKTIAPSVVIGGAYSYVYCYGLSKVEVAEA